MPFKFLIVPTHDSQTAEAELNAFLGSHRIVSLTRRWVERGPSSFWSFCIQYLDSAATQSGPQRPANRTGKVDYREKFRGPDFDLFSRLRDVRKSLAQAEGIPIYMVFNNDHLGQMVERRARTKADLETIAGVGDSRVAKYGEKFLEVLTQEWSRRDEAGGKPV